jgi:hypothetical protein
MDDRSIAMSICIEVVVFRIVTTSRNVIAASIFRPAASHLQRKKNTAIKETQKRNCIKQVSNRNRRGPRNDNAIYLGGRYLV